MTFHDHEGSPASDAEDASQIKTTAEIAGVPPEQLIEDPCAVEAEPIISNDLDIQVIPEDKQQVDPLSAMEVQTPKEAQADLLIEEAKFDVSQEVLSIIADPEPAIKQEPEPEKSTPQLK